MAILLTGQEGYVGAGLYRYLNQNHEVIGWGKGQDVCAVTAELIKDLSIHAVFNCAAAVDRGTRTYDPDSLSDTVNVGGARALVLALKGTDIPLVQISTKDVFGNVYSADDVTEDEFGYRPKFMVDDNHTFAPETIYAKSKLMAEFICEAHPQSMIVRLSSCYTDFSHHRGSWIVKLAKALLAGEPVTTTHNGKQFRDLLHCDDLGRLFEIILEARQFGLKLNSGGGPENVHSVLEVIHMMSEDPTIEQSNIGGDFGFAFSNKRVRETFQWEPRVLFTEQVATILDNVKEGRCADDESGSASCG